MKILVTLISFFIVLVFMPSIVLAQSDNHTAREEAEGKAVWEKLQARETSCDNLSEEDFGALGEYYMGQMVGSSHEQMNQMMIQMMGKEGEEQMHIVMGKRLSGCYTSAQLPQGGMGFMPMMWMIRGGGNSMMNPWGGMMSGWGGLGLGWLSVLLFWVFLILGVIALIRYLTRGQGKEHKNPFDILRERYARGEIDRKEFEQMKKDLS